MKSTFPGASRTSCLSKIKRRNESNENEVSVRVRVKENRDPKKLNLDFQVKDFHISLVDKWDGVDKTEVEVRFGKSGQD